MKHLMLLLALTCVCAALRAQTDPAAPIAEPSNPPANTAPPNAETPAPEAAPVEAPLPPPEAAPAAEGGTNGLRLNFRGVPLDAVLEYLSDAAGFIIVKEARVRGTVDVWSNQPLTRDEAVNLLNTVLKKNGYAAIRNGRTLSIVNRDEAKTHDIPVISGSDPAQIPRTDEIVTQIIPVRFVEVTQLVKDLQPLVSQQSTITANEAGNAIVMTDTQANIRRVAEIIRAIDAGAEEFTEVRVFRLTNSDPIETADLLANLFPDDTSRSGSGSQSPFQGFGGRFLSRFGGGPGGSGGGGNNNASNAQNQRIKKRNRVIAVADQRTASLVVSATRDLMEQIAVVIAELDDNRKGRQTVKIYKLENADPQEALPVLQDLFQKNTTQNSRNGNNQNSALINRSTTQNNQNNSGSRTGTMTPNNRGGVGGGGGFQ